MLKCEKGFTLIELMIVVLIIGVLVAIAVPTYGTMVGKTRDESCRHNLRAIDAAIAQYEAENGSPPPDVAALVVTKFLKDVPREPHPGYAGYTIAGGWAWADGGHQNYP